MASPIAGLLLDMDGVFYVGDQLLPCATETLAELPRFAVSLGLPPEQVAVIGDDIDSDIGGAQNYGLRGILVRTGKYREALLEHSESGLIF